MIAVCTSDWHLDQSTAGVDRYDDTCAAIDVSVDAAIEMKADAYIMNGDLANPNTVRAHRAAAKATDVQRRCHDHGIESLFVTGNHDVIEDGSGMSTMEALARTGLGHVFKFPEIRVFKGCTIIALPFTPTSHDYDPDAFVRECAKRVLAGPMLVLGHLNLEGISAGSETTEMPRGRSVFWPLDALKECFPDAALVGGHYHAPQEYKGVQIIGSMARLRFDECDNDLGYLVMEV